ncbi:MAG TPA: tetratricopeptide repeat protein [Blastocatellia bacterium]|nr:tetratricopeptide repeat protein [Blastocatellia bacterium]
MLYRRKNSRKSEAQEKNGWDEVEDLDRRFFIGDSTGESNLFQLLDQSDSWQQSEVERPKVELTYNGYRAVPAAALIAANPLSNEPPPELESPALTPGMVQEVNFSAPLLGSEIEGPLLKERPLPVIEPEVVSLPQPPVENRVQVPLLQLPPPLPEFTGRSFALAELFAVESNPEIKVLSLEGVGGVGKTALAVKLAHQLAARYPDAQLYIDLKGARGSSLPLIEAQAQVIRAFLPAARLPIEEAELRRMYQAALSGKRVLLLLDNAASTQQVAPLLPPENCFSIITSRQEISLPGMFTMRLDSLSILEARQLLDLTTPSIGEQAERIALLCGRLPLALQLAASTLRLHPELQLEDYARRLRTLQNQEPPMKPVESVLHLSYQLLFPEMQQLWRLLAVFSDTFDVNAAASVLGVNPGRASDLLTCFMAHSLVQSNRATGRFHLHDLMLHYAGTRLLNEERMMAEQRHAAHYESVLHEADALYEQGGEFLKRGLGLLDLEWHNIQQGQAWAAGQMDRRRAACELCAGYPDAGKYVRDLRQHPRERIRWSESALAAARKLQRRKAMARHLIALGDSYADLSEAQRARECYEQALELVIAINDRRGEAHALNGLGMAHYLGGGLNRSREYHEATLEIARSIKDQRVEAVALGHLAVTHFALGEARRAVTLFEQQLKVAREIGDRRNESVALGGLGLAQNSLGQAELALDWLDQQLAITREIGDRRAEASALCSLGNAYLNLNDHQRAIKLQRQALAVAHETGDRRSEANALGGLGLIHYRGGELETASSFFEEQLKLTMEIGDRRGESLARLNLGQVRIALGDSRQAIELLEQAFNIASQIGDTLGQANSVFKLSLALEQFGDHKQAVGLAMTALDIFETVRHPDAEHVRKQLIEWGELS